MYTPLVQRHRFSVIAASLLVAASVSHAQRLPEQATAAAAAVLLAPPFKLSAGTPPLPAGFERTAVIAGESPDVTARSTRAHVGKLSKRKLPAQLPPKVPSTTEE